MPRVPCAIMGPLRPAGALPFTNMRILIAGVCGFVGSSLAQTLLARHRDVSVVGIDNLQRPGSETNRRRMKEWGVEFVHADVRATSDLENLPAADWVIDAAANPSVLAGLQGGSRQLVEHNLISVVNMLEYCKRHQAGLVLISTSRVYSIAALRDLPLKVSDDAFRLDDAKPLPEGVSGHGIGPAFSTAAPISLYGSTKLAAEALALDYGEAFGFPVWIDRCGVLAGAGQFGTPDQGIFAYWINAHLRKRPLRYIGFDGKGKQARDVFHPRDLAALVNAQMRTARRGGRRIYTAGGGPEQAASLAQLTRWCDVRFGLHTAQADSRERPYDIPWMAMDNSLASEDFAWRPAVSVEEILSEIAEHAEQHPDWLGSAGL